MKEPHILVINPGSTSTKVSIFEGENELFSENIEHPIEDLSRFNRASDQDLYRMELIIHYLQKKKIDATQIKAIVGRGGLLKPIEGGTYRVNPQMVADLRKGIQGDHPSNCGGLIAYAIGRNIGCEAFIVDPVVVDELQNIARLSGLPLFQRRSIFHALNQKAVARQAAKSLGKNYTDVNVIVAHLGGGITVGAHHKGRVIDVNNGLDGDGPYSPERSGGVPVGDLVRVCFSGEYTYADMRKLIKGHGGVVAYLGTRDMKMVEKEVEKGNEEYRLIFEGLAYQVAKEIGAISCVLKGQVDAICITGGLAHASIIVNWIRDRVEWIAPVMVYPGEEEMKALAQGALRVLRGEEEAKEYR
ncbi:MAG: butyrate kinase [Calditrichaeota bacterium]|nr:butyrate kinase [Calditrichota bacterium]RQV92566.1 MAG: butyrate kinase [bacterium]RQV99640.1 MAG: butyrate kinase [Calditrichota bacterium]